jgi:DNA-binding NarL/FixJ family response regulator
MPTKRVMLANGSRLLREMLQRVLTRAENLEVLQELPDPATLTEALQRFEPEWVILSPPLGSDEHNWVHAFVELHPSVCFMFLSPDSDAITIKKQGSQPENRSNPSLNEFIHIFERDFQHG